MEPNLDAVPGDPAAALPPLPDHNSRGRLERLLRRGDFAVTAELSPPDSADPEDVYRRAAVFEGWVDALNATDGSGANCHMSSVAVCALLNRLGFALVMQVSCRDHNRIAIQGNVLGAAAMGVCSILCLTGDGVEAGDHPDAKPVFDLDSVSLLDTLRAMRDESRFMSGRVISTPPQVFLGAAINPFAPPLDYRPHHLAKKIAAGAQFVQSQYCFDVPRLREYMAQVTDLGLHEECFILIGVGPLASAGAGAWLRSNVAGVHIPDAVLDRMRKCGDPRREGRNVCVEIIEEVREIEGVAGVHVMAYRQEEMAADIIQRSHVLKGRQPWRRQP